MKRRIPNPNNQRVGMPEVPMCAITARKHRIAMYYSKSTRGKEHCYYMVEHDNEGFPIDIDIVERFLKTQFDSAKKVL